MLSKLLPTLRSALVCTLSLLATTSLAQTTIHVGPGQTYTTIQSGIDAATAGDTVLVAPGTYNENISFKGKAITVTSSGGAAQTILDGGSTGPAVTFNTGETSASTISGFTIQHGGSFSVPVGSVYIQSSVPTILNNTITLSNCWGIDSNYSAPLIQNNTISATQDPKGKCSFGGGSAIIIWGGINHLYNSNGVYSGLILGNTIENNVESGLEDAGGNGGAGITVWGGAPIIEKNIIRNNSSPGGSGGAINFMSIQGTVIAQNLIYGNSAGCGGGAIATDGNGLYVMNNTIVDNVGTATAGYSECANIAQIYPSPGRYGYDNPSDVFINNIISGSTPYPAVNCSSYGAPSEANQPTFENNILLNAGGLFFGSHCVDVSGKYNNIVADPQFVSPSTGDYHLKSTSPAIDSGQNSVLQTFKTMTGLDFSKDFDGIARVQDATAKGCVIDIGAYEYPGSLSNCGVSETLTSSLNPAMAGQSVTFTAQLSVASGTPTGAIQFLDGVNVLSTQTVSGTGSAAFSTNSLTVGSHTITANYQPTGTFGASTASLTQVINGDTTSTALTCLPNPIAIYNTAQLAATVTSANGTPTGSISFTDNGALLVTQSLLSGTTSLAYTGSIAATHNIVATYAPTGPFAASSAACSEVVNPLPTTSTLTVAPATSTYGSPVTLTVTVTPATLPSPSTPTGVVTFLNGASSLGTGTLAGGVATLGSVSLPGGSYNLTCMYSGSSIYATSNCNSVPVIVNAAPTALTLIPSANPANYLSTVTFTARLAVNGQSAGAGNTIQLSINGQISSLTTDATGSATYTIGTLVPNSYPVTASFAATNNLLASSASLTEVITAAHTSIGLTATPNPGVLGQPVTMTATVSMLSTSTPVGNGSIAFYDGSTSLGSSQLSAAGTASMTTSFSTLGVHNLTAVYAGNANFTGSTSVVFAEAITMGDFSISALPGTATVYTGEAATVNVSITSLQGFNQPLALTCTGLPANATCSFSPASIAGGQGTSILTVKTAAPHQAGATAGMSAPMNRAPISGTGRAASAVFLAGLVLLVLPRRFRIRGWLVGLLVVCALLGITSCSGPAPITGGTPPGSYTVAVSAEYSGSSIQLEHSAPIALTVKSLF